MSKNYIFVESAVTGHQELLSLNAFYKKFGKAEGKEILAGYLSEIIAFRTEGCTCGEGQSLDVVHCRPCALYKLSNRKDHCVNVYIDGQYHGFCDFETALRIHDPFQTRLPNKNNWTAL